MAYCLAFDLTMSLSCNLRLVQQQAEEAGEDWERKRAWNYSAEAVEKWEERQEKKAKRAENDFTGRFGFVTLSFDT